MSPRWAASRSGRISLPPSTYPCSPEDCSGEELRPPHAGEDTARYGAWPGLEDAADRRRRVVAVRVDDDRHEAVSSDDRLLDDLARREIPDAGADLVIRLLAALAADTDRVRGL